LNYLRWYIKILHDLCDLADKNTRQEVEPMHARWKLVSNFNAMDFWIKKWKISFTLFEFSLSSFNPFFHRLMLWRSE
jgi:hypothetical protein